MISRNVEEVVPVVAELFSFFEVWSPKNEGEKPNFAGISRKLTVNEGESAMNKME